MNPSTIDDLKTFAENVQYSANWRDSLAMLAIILAAEFQAQAPAVAPEAPAQ